MKLRRLKERIIGFRIIRNFMVMFSEMFMLYNLNEMLFSLTSFNTATFFQVHYYSKRPGPGEANNSFSIKPGRLFVGIISSTLTDSYHGRAETSQKAQACVSHGATCHGMPARLPVNMTQPG